MVIKWGEIMNYENQTFEVERSLYNISNSVIKNCVFEGKIDGESPLKECHNIKADSCTFNLRYPFWHNKKSSIINSSLKDNSRAPFWYCKDLIISNVNCQGIKAIRESKNIGIEDSTFNSEEFGWKSKNIVIEKSSFNGNYFLFNSKNVNMENSKLTGKYSFQYMNNVHIENCILNTKDAFWHSSNVVVVNSELNGEYIGWYSNNITLINCIIKGTQPFCYCKRIKLINCKMVDADFAFENTTVKANLIGSLISIKNPISCKIVVDDVQEIILDDYKKKGHIKIIKRNK